MLLMVGVFLPFMLEVGGGAAISQRWRGLVSFSEAVWVWAGLALAAGAGFLILTLALPFPGIWIEWARVGIAAVALLPMGMVLGCWQRAKEQSTYGAERWMAIVWLPVGAMVMFPHMSRSRYAERIAAGGNGTVIQTRLSRRDHRRSIDVQLSGGGDWTLDDVSSEAWDAAKEGVGLNKAPGELEGTVGGRRMAIVPREPWFVNGPGR